MLNNIGKIDARQGTYYLPNLGRPGEDRSLSSIERRMSGKCQLDAIQKPWTVRASSDSDLEGKTPSRIYM